MGSEEMLKQSVFSSIHMSSVVKTSQVSLSYPCCSFCGGMVPGKTERKVAVFQASLYTNASEPFIVWYKKQEEPKGILWLRSSCVRRGTATEGQIIPIELISKGCRGRCSYTLKFTTRALTEEWYRLLKQESRRMSPAECEDPFSSDNGEDSNPLDTIFSETTPTTTTNSPERKLVSVLSSSPPKYTPTSKPVQAKKKLSTKKKNGFRIPFTSSIVDRKISLPSSVDLTSPDDDAIARWSWPVKV